MGLKEIREEFEESNRRAEEAAEGLKKRVRAEYMGLTLEQMKENMRTLEDSTLQFLCEIALPHEDYEICQAVNEVMEERNAKEGAT